MIALRAERPFVGRRRELGILTHLIEESLSNSWCLVRVAAEPGMGRRRLIAEALHHGPDAEWVHLAPGETSPDFRRWACTELLDLLESYPEAPHPSWALHALARWEPRLRRWAKVPAWTAEDLPSEAVPEVLGAAMGALLDSLTAQTQVIVDAGLWPRAGSAGARALASLCARLGVPGAVVIAAVEPDPPGTLDAERSRTLSLGPLRPGELSELTARWQAETPGGGFSAWLHRVTGGHPFFVKETLRWLEELGHLRVDDERGRVEILSPLDRLPLPFNLHAVMDARYQRLPASAARLLGLIAREDGRLDREPLRERSGLESDAFEEALATLRRREFLLRRTMRRPIATSSPLWGDVAAAAGERRRPRRRGGPRGPREKTAALASGAPLAQGLRRLERLSAGGAVGRGTAAGTARELAATCRLARGRVGPGWDSLRGRLALAAADHRKIQGRVGSARRWIAWGLAHTSREIHPALRRALCRADAALLDAAGKAREAAATRELALEESLAAGHLISAARLEADLAESFLHLDAAERAEALARDAQAALTAMGLSLFAERAGAVLEQALAERRRARDIRNPLHEAPARPRPEFRGVELRLLGRPAVLRADSTWPIPLWPQWWLALWCGAASADLLGRDFDRAAAQQAVADAGDAPAVELEHLLVLANQLLRGHETVAGGLRAEDDRIAVGWSGIRCDARDLFALAERMDAPDAQAPPGPSRSFLDGARGAYLPGIPGVDHDAVRARLHEWVRFALAQVIAEGGEIGAGERTRWLEEAGRAGPVAVLLADLSEGEGRERSACALRRGPP